MYRLLVRNWVLNQRETLVVVDSVEIKVFICYGHNELTGCAPQALPHCTPTSSTIATTSALTAPNTLGPARACLVLRVKPQYLGTVSFTTLLADA